MPKKSHSNPQLIERAAEQAEYRFYYLIILPICLLSTALGRLDGILRGNKPKPELRGRSILSIARTQANDIVPYIFSR